MTISSTTRKAGPYPGNGVTTSFPFSFKIFDVADLRVVVINISTQIQTVLTLNVDYTGTLNPDQNSNPGGTINKVTPLPSGTHLVITSNIAQLQQTDLTNQGGFYPEVITDALDKLTILLQQVSLTSNAALFFPITDETTISGQLPPALVRANNVLTFDATGAPVASIAAADVQVVAANITAVAAVGSNITSVNTNAANISAITSAAANIAAIIDAPAAAASAASSASTATTQANNASASAVAAAAAVAAAGLPTNLAGHAKEFLRVKEDTSGWDLVSSVAAPVFYGFVLNPATTELTLTYGRDDYDVANFSTWTMSENVSFSVLKNQLTMVLA